MADFYGTEPQLDGELRSPSGSFTARISRLASQVKPDKLILSSPEPEMLARKGSSSVGASLAASPKLSPKPGKDDDPMMAWPACPGSARGASPGPGADVAALLQHRSASLAGHQCKQSGDHILGDNISPRRHSLSGLASFPPLLPVSCAVSPVPAPLMQSHCCSAAASPRPCAHDAEGVEAAACTSPVALAGFSPSSSTAAAAAGPGSEPGRQRWPGTAPRPKPQAAVTCGEHLQSQTHAALQQLSIKQPVKRRDSESQLHSLPKAAEGEVQRWSLARGAAAPSEESLDDIALQHQQHQQQH